MNYPNKKPNKDKKTVVNPHSKLGMSLEKDINTTNEYYLYKDLAIVYKKPTPIKIVKVNYASRKTAKITEAYYNTPSTTDYNGIYKGKYIDFEAKETHSKTSFPFSSIPKHQVMHLERCVKHGGITFVVIRFVMYDKTYLIKAKDFVDFYKGESRKSLPYSWVKENGYEIEYNYLKPCDYLKVVDKVFK